MKKTIKCYRFVNDDLTSDYDNKTQWKIGEWKKAEGTIKPCENGLHASLTPFDSINNVFGNRWFIAEARGKIVKEGDKFAASEMRVIKEIPSIVLKRFALFCAKDCLKNYEKEYPNDNRISECIRITELYLDGKTDIDTLKKSIDTAKSAKSAESATWSAAESAESATWSAAWSAAESAAESAWSAAESAESATWSAAWSAAESAWSAAESAESATWSAAWSAAESAWSAAKKRQAKELNKLIKEYVK